MQTHIASVHIDYFESRHLDQTNCEARVNKRENSGIEDEENYLGSCLIEIKIIKDRNTKLQI